MSKTPTEPSTNVHRSPVSPQVLSCRFTSSGEVSELQWTLQEQLDEFRRGAPLDEMAPEPPAEVLQGTLMAFSDAGRRRATQGDAGRRRATQGLGRLLVTLLVV